MNSAIGRDDAHTYREGGALCWIQRACAALDVAAIRPHQTEDLETKLTSLLAPSIALLLLAPITAPAASTSGLSLPVMGTVDRGGAFTGTFQLQRFAMQAGKLVA